MAFRGCRSCGRLDARATRSRPRGAEAAGGHPGGGGVSPRRTSATISIASGNNQTGVRNGAPPSARGRVTDASGGRNRTCPSPIQRAGFCPLGHPSPTTNHKGSPARRLTLATKGVFALRGERDAATGGEAILSKTGDARSPASVVANLCSGLRPGRRPTARDRDRREREPDPGATSFLLDVSARRPLSSPPQWTDSRASPS